MQKLNNYIRYFKHKPFTRYQSGVSDKLIKEIHRFDAFYKNHIPTNGFAYISWTYNNDREYYLNDYNDLIRALAEYLGVKVMYRDQLDHMDMPVKGYFIIGDEQRVQICSYIFNYYYNYSLNLEITLFDSLKVAKKKNSRKIIIELLKNITNSLKELLVIDLRYTIYLETYILNNFKLDYKNYKGTKQYYHALSSDYYHKRMAL